MDLCYLTDINFFHRPKSWVVQVIGGVGFGKKFGSLECLDQPAEQDVFRSLALGETPLLKKDDKQATQDSGSTAVCVMRAWLYNKSV